MSTNKTQKPTDVLKRKFEEFLEEKSKGIATTVMFGLSQKFIMPVNVEIPLIKIGLITCGNNYFLYQVKLKKGGNWFLEFTKILNAKLHKVKAIKLIHNNKTVKPNSAYFEIIFETDNGEISEPVILDEKAKSNCREFNQSVNKSNNRIVAKFDETSFCLFLEYLNKVANKTVLSFTNSGRVNYKNFLGRIYSDGYLKENGEIIPANEYNEIEVGNQAIMLDKSKLAHLPSIYFGEYDTKAESKKLLEQTYRVYKGKIEPFLCLGTAIMCIFLEEIWNNLSGFPVIFLQGDTKQGKSLLQGIIYNIFGYSKKQMSMGNSTDNAIAMKCFSVNSTPIAINDYDMYKAQGNAFENNTVHFYEAGVREKMYNGYEFNLQPISSVPIFSSNYMPCMKEKILNRMLPLYFPNNGINTLLITNDYSQDRKRSRILAEVIKFDWDKVSNLIDGLEQHILSWKIFPNKDRESNNVAIAYAGLVLLENISEYKVPNQDALIKEYCQWYKDLVEKTNTPVENFLNSLVTLYAKKVLKLNENFKLELIKGRIIFICNTQECIKLYNSFFMQDGNYQLKLNSKTFAYDLKASKYFIERTNQKYKGGQANSAILDITDNFNSKYFYYLVTGNREAVFSDEPYKIEGNNSK